MCVWWVIFENCFIRWITYDLLDECVWKLVFERLCFTKFEENFFQTNVSDNFLKVRNVAEAGFLFVMSLRPKFLSDIGQLKMSASQRSVRPAIMCHCGVIMCHCDVIMCHRDVIIGQRLSTVVVLDPQQTKVKNWIFFEHLFLFGSLVFRFVDHILFLWWEGFHMIHFSLCYCANVRAGVKIKKFGDL